MGIEENVGKNIKKYRQAYKMTLDDLAGKIHKSKSTVSKYEKGIIAIDISTLDEISKVLNVSPARLMVSDNEKNPEDNRLGEFIDYQYMYSYDGRSKRIQKSIIERYRMPDTEEIGIQMFYDVSNVQDPGDCKTLYSGVSRKYEFIENYNLQNQNNPTEQALICCINSLNRTNRKIGMVTGLSYRTMLPVALKVMISSVALKEDQELISQLCLTKEDIKISKKFNQFTIDRFTE